MLYYVAIVIAAVIILYYWRSRSNAAAKRVSPSISVLFLGICMIYFVVLYEKVDQWGLNFQTGGQLIALAIVYDTSLSMYAGPDPTRYPEVKTRLDRSKDVILEVLNRLDEDRTNILVSLIIFTVRAANVLGWNPNLREVSIIIDRALNTNLIGRGGTDLGGALARSVEVFDTLSDREKANTRKILWLVSDGERTVDMVDLNQNLEAIKQQDIAIISMQVGFLDEPEGIREYDEFGFTGFWTGMGETYTIPDTNTMIEIAGLDDGQGLYVRAEDPQASGRILEFLQGERKLLTQSLNMDQIITLCLWLVSIMMLIRLFV